MEDEVIMLEVFQPFAQYRNPFTFYYAQTYPLPPKSTIIGMLQNATYEYYGKYYNEEFWNLEISVHGGFESVFWNYQNLIKGEIGIEKFSGLLINKHKDNITTKVGAWLPLYPSDKSSVNLLSRRSPVSQQELFNGHLFIFIKGESKFIAKIESALRRPSKILYLGRSEDVIFIRKIYTQDDLEKTGPELSKGFFRVSYPTYIKLKHKKDGQTIKFPISKDKFPVYFVGTKVKFKNGDKLVQNKAEITKETEREAEFEPVIYAGAGSVIVLKDPEKYKDAVPIEISTFKILKNSKRMIFKIPEEFGWL